MYGFWTGFLRASLIDLTMFLFKSSIFWISGFQTSFYRILVVFEVVYIYPFFWVLFNFSFFHSFLKFSDTIALTILWLHPKTVYLGLLYQWLLLSVIIKYFDILFCRRSFMKFYLLTLYSWLLIDNEEEMGDIGFFFQSYDILVVFLLDNEVSC